MRNVLSFILAVIITLSSCLPVFASASEGNILAKIKVGESYEFINQGTGSASIGVNTALGCSYDYAAYNKDGTLNSSAINCNISNIVLPEKGRVVVTVKNLSKGISTYNFFSKIGNVIAKRYTNQALFTVSLKPGESYEFTTKSKKGLVLNIKQAVGCKYDFVSYKKGGSTSSSALNSTASSLFIPEEGKLVVTVKSLDKNVQEFVIGGAYEWVSGKPCSDPALYSTSLGEGESYEFRNNSPYSEKISVALLPGCTYDTVIYSKDGTVASTHFPLSATDITVPEQGRVVVTVRKMKNKGEKLLLGGSYNSFSGSPSALPALNIVSLKQGESFEFVNKSLSRATINVAYVQGCKFDYATYKKDGKLDLSMKDSYTSMINVPAEGKAVITVKNPGNGAQTCLFGGAFNVFGDSQKVLKPNTPPVLTGFSGTYEVEMGKTFKLPGKIISSSNITKINIGVPGWYDSIAAAAPNSATYDLSRFTIDTSKWEIKSPGEYIINLWVKSEAFPDPKTEAGRITLKVKSTKVETEKTPNTIEIFPGQAKSLQGKLKLKGTVTAIGAEIKRVGDFEYKKTIYNDPGFKSSEFDLSKISISATGEFLSVPGNFELKITTATKESLSLTEAAKYIIKVVDPIVYKEVRYLPYTDQVYVRADIHGTVGQKNEKEWPAVWTGIYNDTLKQWDYLAPDKNNLLKHIGYNSYEMYIPASILNRGHQYRFMLFLDGYCDYASFQRYPAHKLAITPLPRQNWDVRYNIKKDVLEVLATPITPSNTPLKHDYYLVVFDENLVPVKSFHPDKFDALTEVTKADSYTSEVYNASYYRAWDAYNELGLLRGKTYKYAVVARGYEGQLFNDSVWLGAMVKPLKIHTLAINNWKVRFDHASEKLTVSGKCQAVSDKYAIKLGIEGKGTFGSFELEYSTQFTPQGYFSEEFDLKSLGLSVGNNYKMYMVIVDANGSEIQGTKTKSVEVGTHKPVTPAPTEPPATPSGPVFRAGGSLVYAAYEEYAKTHSAFDASEYYSFRDSDHDTALYGKINLVGLASELPNAVGEVSLYKLEQLDKYIRGEPVPEEDWTYNYSKNLYKDEIRKMLKSLDESDTIEKAVAWVDTTKKKITKYTNLDVELKDDTNISDWLFSKSVEYSKTDPQLADVFDNLHKKSKNYKEFAKKYHVSKAVTAFDYLLLLAGAENVANNEIYAFKDVADYVEDRIGKNEFTDAVYELHSEYNKEKNRRMEIFAQQVAKDLLAEGFTQAVKLFSKRAVPLLGIADAIFMLVMEEQRTSLNSTIMNGNIKYYAGKAYAYYRKTENMDGKRIRSAGVVYLLASEAANRSYAEFNTIISGREWTVDDFVRRDCASKAVECKARAERIAKVVKKWMTDAKLE
ncbi:MAG: hypothetical protein N3B21_19020 [Clostridia bacterium]|nr:hypothetical protein [Clostridia bacterium]